METSETNSARVTSFLWEAISCNHVLRTSVKVGMLIEYDPKNNFRSGAILDLTFGDLKVPIIY
jgi:hypothetical protein